MRWESFKLLTFDCYGTLVDWEAGIPAVLHPWAERNHVRAFDDELLVAFGEAVPARRLGFATVWVDRRAGCPGGAAPRASGDVAPDLRVTFLRELVEIEGRERGV